MSNGHTLLKVVNSYDNSSICTMYPPNCTILSDNGNSFKDGEKDILIDLGFKYHLCYPAVVHQYLSPNDNKFHGAAKRKWKNLGLDFTDDVKSSIALLHCLDECCIDVQAWFHNNLRLKSNIMDVKKKSLTLK